MLKNYLGLLAIIAVSLLLFVTVSFCTHDYEDTTLKRATFADLLLKEIETVSDSVNEADMDSINGDIATPVDTATQSILIIGDSMLEGLNKRLADYAKANGHRFNSVIWYSSTTEYWGTCDTLSVFLKRFNPTFIFISLGGNELFVKDIKEKRTKYLKNFVKQLGDIPFVWIGPPNWREDTGINEMIEQNVGRGQYFRSNGMHFDRQKDGAHPTYQSAALWFDSIARWMPEHAAHPIRLEKPADSVKGRPNSVVVLQPKH